MILMIIFIASCTRISHDRCKINGNEDYLYSSLSRIYVPDDIILPNMDKEYEIPYIDDNSALNAGKRLNICPPNIEY